ncbi:MAG: hypothetical protein H7Y42_14765 [Chitinophagaceae bacterium]|nr:hypothetical protein [Chitinophagaceae bacterium]
MKILFFIVLLGTSVSLGAQSLKDSLYGGKLRNDAGKTAVSTDTGKYVAPIRNETISSQPSDNKKIEVKKLDENMPDSLNKLYYAKQKSWKRFIENNVSIISQEAESNRKVKKGEYNVEIEYEIGLNGRVTTKEITVVPHNEFIVEKVQQMMMRPPVLSPPIYADGKPRIGLQKQPMTIVKK